MERRPCSPDRGQKSRQPRASGVIIGQARSRATKRAQIGRSGDKWGLCGDVIARGIVALCRLLRGLAGALTLARASLRLPALTRHLRMLRQAPRRVCERPSHGSSRGGCHLHRNTTPDKCSAIIAARALRAIHHFAPAGSISVRICLCTLLATPRRDSSTMKITMVPVAWRYTISTCRSRQRVYALLALSPAFVAHSAELSKARARVAIPCRCACRRCQVPSNAQDQARSWLRAQLWS